MPAPVSDLLLDAEAARALVNSDPDDAARRAEAILASTDDHEVLSVAEGAYALAVRELGRTEEAEVRLRHAVAVAESGELPRRAAEARLSLVVVLGDRGDADAALVEADLAAPSLTGVSAGRLHSQRSLILQRIGRYDQALEGYQRALPLLRRSHDVQFEALTLLRRGVLHAYRGEHRAAEKDLTRSHDLAAAHGLDLLRGMALNNLGFAAYRAGDLPKALGLLDLAIDRLAHFRNGANAALDRAEVLTAAGLGEEAARAAAAAAERFAASGFAADLAEAKLALARAFALAGAPAAARAAAAEAYELFRDQGRECWAVAARSHELRARFDSGERSEGLLADAERCHRDLTGAGWRVDAASLGLVAARTAAQLGDAATAERLLGEIAARRRRGPAESRATSWHAEALRRLGRGDERGTLRAVRAGLRVLEENAATLGATDLRASAAVHGHDLAALALSLVLRDHRAREALQWAEQHRAASLRPRAVRPPADTRLAAELAQLRSVVSDITAAALDGRDVRSLHARRDQLEAGIRDRARHARGDGRATPRLDVAELLARLGERVLVEYVRDGDRLVALVAVDARVRLVGLGPYEPTIREMESLRFAVNRVAHRHGGPRLTQVARDTLRRGAELLDHALLRPLAALIADRELVLVPTGALHALPWTVLPSCAGRAVSVAPSAAVWADTARHPRPSGRRSRSVLVAGPGLEHAEPEIAALVQRYPGAVRLTGEEATAAGVAAAIDGADLAHVAAHGRFRADNPLFSDLSLADGPLTVYDLERLRRAPRRIVLSACESALSAVRPGDELMGLAGALFALGTRTLVASVTPVPDEETRTLMPDFHARLIRGTPPARALAEAQQATGAIGFVCFGAG